LFVVLGAVLGLLGQTALSCSVIATLATAIVFDYFLLGAAVPSVSIEWFSSKAVELSREFPYLRVPCNPLHLLAVANSDADEDPPHFGAASWIDELSWIEPTMNRSWLLVGWLRVYYPKRVAWLVSSVMEEYESGALSVEGTPYWSFADVFQSYKEVPRAPRDKLADELRKIVKEATGGHTCWNSCMYPDPDVVDAAVLDLAFSPEYGTDCAFAAAALLRDAMDKRSERRDDEEAGEDERLPAPKRSRDEHKKSDARETKRDRRKPARKPVTDR
jgi:hypothetical protein